MPGLLDGALAQAVFAGFKGKLQSGTLRRDAPLESAGLDDRGDAYSTFTQTWGFEGFKEGYSAFIRATAGIPELDVKINIFAASLDEAAGPPQKDDLVLLAGQWWQLRKADTDPATALWVCQAFGIRAPEGA